MAIPAILINEVQQLIEINNIRMYRRHIRDTTNPFELSDSHFKKIFRLGKFTVRQLIEEISPYMDERIYVTHIPKHVQIFAALSFFGCGSYQLEVGQSFHIGMSQPSVSRAVSKVTEAIRHIANRKIKFPRTIQEKTALKRRFQEKYNFPYVVGAIDCTHIAIIAPPVNDVNYPGRIYFNRKGYASINTQLICDADMNILSINARFPGSTHDAAIWSTSDVNNHLNRNFVNGDNSTYLLGDSGYPLLPWLLVPFEGPAEGTPEAAFNRAHIRCRNVVERCNGVLKGRFRCLLRHRTLNYSPVKAAQIIIACAVLHNIALHYNVVLPEVDIELDPPLEFQNFQDADQQFLNAGRRIRAMIVERYFE